MNAYERLIEQHAKDDVYSFSELSEAEQTELATAYARRRGTYSEG